MGYYLENGICKPCSGISPNCLQCSDSINCQVCIIGFAEPNCAMCSLGKTGFNCSSCIEGYFLESVKVCTLCSTINSQCLICSSNKTCSKCDIGSKGITCSECMVNYGFIRTTKTCYPCPTGFTSTGGTASCLDSSFSLLVNTTTNTTQLINNTGVTVSSNLTLAIPPAINQSVLINLPFNGNDFITSKKLDAFRIVQSVSSAIFEVYSFNRTYTGNLKYASIDNVAGQWSFIKSSEDTLSCVMVGSNDELMFLKYDSLVNIFKIHLRVNKADILSTAADLASIKIG